MTPPAPSVTIAVVTYNSALTLPGFLGSIDGGTEGVSSWQLVVVDNASVDNSTELVRAQCPDAVVVNLGTNRGYAAGINAAAAALPSDAVLAINPDVRLGHGAVRQLLSALAEPGVGIAVPRIEDSSGRLDPTLRRDPTVLRAWGEAILGGHRAGRFARFGELVTDPDCYEDTTYADWASGSVMLVSRACLDTVGPWDESFFLYSEETEFAQRAREAGFAIRLEPRAAAVHLRGESATSPHLRSLGVINKVRLYQRRHGRVSTVAFRAGLMVNELLRVWRGKAHRAAFRALLVMDLDGTVADTSGSSAS